MWPRLHATGQPPCHEGDEGDDDYRGHEDGGDAVNDTLHGRFATLRAPHHVDDVRQHGVTAHGTRRDAQLALAHEGARHHFVALATRHGEGLAAYHTLVDIAFSVAHHTVDGELVAGHHLDDVAGLQCGHGDHRHFFALHEAGLLGRESHECAYGAGGAALGALLKQASGEHKGDNHRGGLEIGVPFDASRAPVGVAPKCVEHAQPERGRGAQSHQGVHARVAVPQLTRGVDIKVAPAIQRHAQCEQHGGKVVVKGPAYAQPSHRERHDHSAAQPSDDDTPQQAPTRGAFLGHHVAVVLNDQVVTGARQGVFHRLLADVIILNGDGASRQVHVGAFHTGHTS